MFFIMIAIATAASAAAMAMMNNVKNSPSIWLGHKYLLNAMKLRFTLFSMSSILISIVIRFLRVRNPYTPIKNSAVLRNNIWYNPGCIILILFLFLKQLQYILSTLPIIKSKSLQRAMRIHHYLQPAFSFLYFQQLV